MNDTSKTVSLHPYFRIKPGCLPAVKALLPAFVAKASTESAILYYDFTFNGDELFCREAYVGAEGTLAHVENVGALLTEMLKFVTLIRFEVHGPADELEKLKTSLAALNPVWFVYETGVRR